MLHLPDSNPTPSSNHHHDYTSNRSPHQPPLTQRSKYSLPRNVISRQPLPPTTDNNARHLQRIDMLLNLVYLRVSNDRALALLLNYVPEQQAEDIVSNFAYVRHQQDTQEIRLEMTDKQMYRIFRHHYRAEQRLADKLRHLRHENGNNDHLPEQAPPENTTALAHAVANIANDSAKMRAHYLERVETDLQDMSLIYQSDEDLLYVHEFSQAQQISTMQSRCTAMKDDFEADDMRKGRHSWIANEVQKTTKETISGPEDWDDNKSQSAAPASSFNGFGLSNVEWAPPDSPRPPPQDNSRSLSRMVGDKEYEKAENTMHRASDTYEEKDISFYSSKDGRERRSGHEAHIDDRGNKYQGRDRRGLPAPQNSEAKAEFSKLAARDNQRYDSSQPLFAATNPRRKEAAHHVDIRSRQGRTSRRRLTLPAQKRAQGHRSQNHMPQGISSRPQRTPHARVNPRNKIQGAAHAVSSRPNYEYSNAEYATMPNLNRTSLGYRNQSSYDDDWVPLQSGSGHKAVVRGHRFGMHQQPFPHESNDAYAWKSPGEMTNNKYRIGSSPGHVVPSANQPSNPYGQTNLPLPDFPQDAEQTSYTPEPQPPASTRTRKRDEWRYSNAFSSGLLDSKESRGVMQSIANRMKGKKGKSSAPKNPIEAMQLARNDPVKFMTTMVAGEVVPQVKRKAHKIEGMLAEESKVSGVTGQVGQMLTKLTKDSKTEAGHSKAGASSQVGQMLTKMTLDAVAGSGGKSKVGVTSQVGNVLAKVAKDSVKEGGPSNGAGVFKQVMNSLKDA